MIFSKEQFFFIVFCLAVTVAAAKQGDEKILFRDCAAAGAGASICTDCKHFGRCDAADGVPTVETECPGDTVCLMSGTLAFCDEPSSVPECDCPPSTNEIIPMADAYNSERYLLCLNDEITMAYCETGINYDPDLGECGDEGPVIPDHCSEDIPLDRTKVNCTHYRQCTEAGWSDPISCDPGEIFDTIANECIFYAPFSCTSENSYQRDFHDCSVCHACVDGVQQGMPFVCANGLNFDEACLACSADAVCDGVVEDCGICSDGSTRIPIDCYSYYQCTENVEDGLSYVPVLKTCPPDYYYDAVNNYCSTIVDGCP